MSDPANPNVPLRDGNAITWDELFPPESNAQTASPAATTPAVVTPQNAQAPAAQQAVTAPAAPVIQTKTGTVYKTVEDAIKGIEHKDTVIADMRSRMILATGIDPLTGQPAQQTASQQQPAQKNYMQDKKGFYDDLVTAAQKNDAEGVWNAQAKLVFDALAPIAPVLSDFAKEKAVSTVSSEIKDFREFYSSDNYKQALNETPELANAIAIAENNLQEQHRLAGLYKVAYRISQGLRLPEILRSQQPAPASQPVRQTTAAQTLTPTTANEAQPNLYTKEGRKALQSRFEASGFADMPLV